MPSLDNPAHDNRHPEDISISGRTRLASPEITRWVRIIKDKILSLPFLSHIESNFTHVLYLRLFDDEREMLEKAIFRDKDVRAYLTDHPDVEEPLRRGHLTDQLAESVAALLFLRWYVWSVF